MDPSSATMTKTMEIFSKDLAPLIQSEAGWDF